MNLKEIAKTALNLVVFCLVVGFILSFYNQVTRAKIQENEREEVARVREQLLPADKYREIEGIPGVVKAYKDGKFIGYIVETTSSGYSSNIKIIYSATPHYEIKGVNIVSQQETPGLGNKIEEDVKLKQFGDEPFVAQFAGKGIEQLKIGNENKPNPSSIAAITGATISSTAVTRGIRESLEELKKAIKAKTQETPAQDEKTTSMNPGGFLEVVYASEEKIDDKLKKLLPAQSYERIYPCAYKATSNGKLKGYIVKSWATVYKDNLILGFSVNPKLEIMDVVLIKNPGGKEYREKVESKEFLSQFKGKTLDTLVLGKTPLSEKTGQGDKCIHAVTGATISSKSVVEAVKRGLEKLKNHLEKK